MIRPSLTSNLEHPLAYDLHQNLPHLHIQIVHSQSGESTLLIVTVGQREDEEVGEGRGGERRRRRRRRWGEGRGGGGGEGRVEREKLTLCIL